MATKSASATLTSTFDILPITGFVPYTQGQLDPASGTIKATGRSTWASLSGTTWADWKNYIQTYNEIRWTAPLLDVGKVQYFTLNIEAEFLGSLSYIVYVSETGAFGGEETQTVIEDGDYSVPAFYGRYVYVTGILKGTELKKMRVSADPSVREYIIPNVNSSTLSGTNTNRVIELPVEVSAIKDIHIQVKAATSYAVNLYVSDTATSEILIPVVKSKSKTTPSFALYGIDNDPRDGVVDITVKALPRQVMYAGNLVVLP